jgi:hypothetical protein
MGSVVAFDPLARGLLAQIRRDIAAAWEQVEAGREILQRSAWLIARWRELDAAPPPLILEQRPSVAGMYIEIVEERPRRQRRSFPVAASHPLSAQAHALAR